MDSPLVGLLKLVIVRLKYQEIRVDPRFRCADSLEISCVSVDKIGHFGKGVSEMYSRLEIDGLVMIEVFEGVSDVHETPGDGWVTKGAPR